MSEALFCPYETETRVFESHIEIHPKGHDARRFVDGYLVIYKDKSKSQKFIRYHAH